MTLRIVFSFLFLLVCHKLTADDPAEFQSIFDGKTLNGWRALPAESVSAWKVEQGVIVGSGATKRSHLEYENIKIRDFEFKFEYRFRGKGNSGVNIRAVPDKTGTRDFMAYHADLGHVGIGSHILGAWDFHTPGRKEHGCGRGNRLVIDSRDAPTVSRIKNGVELKDIRVQDWNRVHLVARGNQFQFWINGKLSSEFTEQLPKERCLERGAIQLQLHDPDMEVHFRKLELKIMDRGP